MGITYSKSRVVPVAEHNKTFRPEGPAKGADYGDWRVSQAFGETGDEAHQSPMDWLMGLGKKGGEAVRNWAGSVWDNPDIPDAIQSVPSALTKVEENTLGAPKDLSGQVWDLAHAINRGQRGITGYDAGLDLMRGQKLDERFGSYLPKLSGSEDIHEANKQNLPAELTYEPQSPLGQGLHFGANFVGPQELGLFKGLEALTGGSRVAEDLSKYKRLPGAPSHIEGPVPEVVDAAHKYAADQGMDLSRQSSYATADPRRGGYIAKAYDEMPHAPQDPKVKASYDALSNETMAQWHALQDAGIDIDFLPPGAPDPYPGGPRDALADLRANRHLHVFPTNQGFGSSELFNPDNNPLLADTGIVHKGHPMVVNDAFRAVHDVFGHGMEGANFGARGEENAWRAHQRLFSEEALPALTSETRGQNSWVNFGPFGEANRANQRGTIFADQKTGVMPKWTTREGGMPLRYRALQAGTAGALGGAALVAGDKERY